MASTGQTTMLAAHPVTQLVQFLHKSPVKLSVNICGAGAAAIGALTQVAGCSSTLLSGEVLYSQAATAAALDYTPMQFVSAVTARHLAQHAYHTSQRFGGGERMATAVGGEILLGVGATSAVETSRQRKGLDQAFVSVWGGPAMATASNPTQVLDAHLLLEPQMRRAQQDEQVALLILHAIGQFLASKQDPAAASALSLAELITGKSAMQWTSFPVRASTQPSPAAGRAAGDEEAAVAVRSVLDGQGDLAIFNKFGEARASAEPFLFPESERGVDGQEDTGKRPIRLLYPGSFRPLHWGHTELAREALRVCHEKFHGSDLPAHSIFSLMDSGHVTYEIAGSIVDKGNVSAADLEARVRQFTQRGERVAVTAATLFVEKAAIFPRHGFIVGIDTAKRILDPKYYEGATEADMITALKKEIGGRGCYFVVGGRAVASGPDGQTTWEDMSSLQVPEALRDLFISVPEERFRVDISSTELRARHTHFTL